MFLYFLVLSVIPVTLDLLFWNDFFVLLVFPGQEWCQQRREVLMKFLSKNVRAWFVFAVVSDSQEEKKEINTEQRL